MVQIKPVEFLGSSRKALAAFPAEARRAAGHQLEKIQRGIEPTDWKRFHSVGPGSLELRVRDASGEFRVFYVAKFDEAIYVLHAFQKKERKTARLDVDLARIRYTVMIRSRAS
jgi:phage-related protein